MLEHITESPTPLSVAEVARDVGMHRSITYRMLRTLEDHGLIGRDDQGRFQAGAGLAVLAGRFTPALRAVAGRHLLKLAVATDKTAFLVVRHGDEAVTIEVVEPPAAAAHVSYRPGLRHPITKGAPGIALLAGEPPSAGERPEVTAARALGWATSTSEVIQDFRAVAAPVVDTAGVCRGAIAVVFAGSTDLSGVAERVMAHALALGLDL
ncbi:MAG: helix-turn-helix domain-containing protein [Actinomycetales bacterium]|nr:helix-turn-helix domain-containing protein [Candidatus Phosphoribacter baldrii]MBK6955377.1 helix-turn-helix domain-containing protein [Candidatus Phosphoribacter baldrii]